MHCCAAMQANATVFLPLTTTERDGHIYAAFSKPAFFPTVLWDERVRQKIGRIWNVFYRPGALPVANSVTAL